MPGNKDDKLEIKVKKELLARLSNAGDIRVEGNNGNIRLSGVVDLLIHKNLAQEIAERVAGVKSVENNITISTDSEVSDKGIEQEVINRLAENHLTSGVGVEVKHGIVNLIGTRETLEQIREAENIAQSTLGVKEVRNNLRIKEWKDDATLTNEVEQVLANSDVGAGYIDTATADGVVHLSGWVNHEEEKEKVKELVRRIRGVRGIESNLRTREDEASDQI